MKRLPVQFISEYWKNKYGSRVQKITVDAGMTCPNRDGKVSTGGCTFCNNESFSPAVKFRGMDIKKQLEQSKNFLAKRYKCNKFLAYFQSYSNTYAPLENLKELYSEALLVEDVIGLAIGTRPDCLENEVLDYLEQLSESKEVILELGLESFNDHTLKLINRGHGVDAFEEAMCKLTKRNIKVGAHIMFGLPSDEKSDYHIWASKLSSYDLHSVKIHQLQLVKGTKLASDYSRNAFSLLTKAEYVDLLILFLRHLSPKIWVERILAEAPIELLVEPSQNWNISLAQFRTELLSKMESCGQKQGDLYLSK